MKISYRPIMLVNEIMSYSISDILCALEDITNQSWNAVGSKRWMFRWLTDKTEKELEEIVRVIHSDNWYDENWDKECECI